MSIQLSSIVAAIGTTLSCLALIYMVGLSLTGFVDYQLPFATIAWGVIIVGIAINAWLIRTSRRTSPLTSRLPLYLLSIVLSLVMLSPVVYGIIRAARP